MIDGAFIKSRRLELGLTQQELADKVYVTRQTISKWELNKSQPDLFTSNLLYEALELTKVEELEPHKNEKKVQLNFDLKQFIIFPLVMLLGPFFFIFRFGYLKLSKPENKLVKILTIGTLFPLLIIYLSSLHRHLLYISVTILSLIYFSTQLYFYYGNKEDEE